MRGKAIGLTFGTLALGLSSGAGARNKAAPPVPVENPGTWFGADAYPPEAIRAGAEGRTVVRVTVDEHGTPSQCYVAISAGHAALDTATCNLAMSRGRFTPGRDARGHALSSTYLLPVRWVLPRNMPDLDLSEGRHLLADQTIELSLNENGAVKGCKTIKSAAQLPDPCHNFPVDTRPFGNPIKNGKPVPATVTMTMLAYVDAN